MSTIIPRDAFHGIVMAYSRTLKGARVVSTDAVFTARSRRWHTPGRRPVSPPD